MKEKNKRWTSDEKEFIQEHLGKMSFDDMGLNLNRSSMSVRLFILRNRLVPRPVISRNLLQQLLKQKFKHPEDFCPGRNFYLETGIGQRRFWALYYGRKAISPKEYLAVAKYLDITPEEAFESRQLELFEKEKKEGEQ